MVFLLLTFNMSKTLFKYFLMYHDHEFVYWCTICYYSRCVNWVQIQKRQIFAFKILVKVRDFVVKYYINVIYMRIENILFEIHNFWYFICIFVLKQEL